MSSRKASTNRNIKKLRAVSMVHSLASSWQQWVTDNETKQASEPSGWTPSSLEEPTEEPLKKWVPRKPPPTQIQPMVALTCEEGHKTTSSHKNTDEVMTPDEPPAVSTIKTKQVVKTVTSKAQERSAGIGLLAEKIQRDALPSAEEIDRLLTRNRSPTRRRKCSNMVSSLTKSWKQVEDQQKFGKDGARPGSSQSGGSEQDESGRPEAETQREDLDEAQTHTVGFLKDCGGDVESAMRIKRPSISAYKKEAEDAIKLSALSKKYSPVGNLKSRWQNWASEHTVNQRLNPFSEYFDHDYSMSLRLQRGQEGYGRPKEGSKTAERAKRAEQHIHREIADMCYVIRTMADPGPDGKTRITFGELFDRYVRISDKVVGILMRARKHGKVAFEGEMLWQGQDNGVVITLLV